MDPIIFIPLMIVTLTNGMLILSIGGSSLNEMKWIMSLPSLLVEISTQHLRKRKEDRIAVKELYANAVKANFDIWSVSEIPRIQRIGETRKVQPVDLGNVEDQVIRYRKKLEQLSSLRQKWTEGLRLFRGRSKSPLKLTGRQVSFASNDDDGISAVDVEKEMEFNFAEKVIPP